MVYGNRPDLQAKTVTYSELYCKERPVTDGVTMKVYGKYVDRFFHRFLHSLIFHKAQPHGGEVWYLGILLLGLINTKCALH